MTTILSKKTNIITTTLPNGFRIIYEKSTIQQPLTSINVFCDLGSIYEKEGYRGVSHFIEHMCFKGTAKQPNARHISEFFDKIGAYFNAYTEKRNTSYIVKLQDEYIKQCLELLADMMLNSAFNKTEFKKELNVVVAENVKNEDIYEDKTTNMINKLLYNGSSYENPVDTIEYHTPNTLKHDTVLNIYNAFYQPNRMVLSIVSNIPFKTILKYVKSSGYNISRIPKNIMASTNNCNIEDVLDELNPYYVKYSYNSQTQILYDILRKPGVANTNLMIGFRTCSLFNKDKYVLSILQEIIGGSMSSRLFTILREQNGLTYSSTITTNNYEKMGDITFYAIMDNKKLMHNNTKKGVLPLIIKLINDLIRDGITKTELDNIKGNLKGSYITHYKDSDIAKYNGIQILLRCHYGDTKYIPYLDVFENRYKNITVREVNEVIHKYFKKEIMSVVLVGGEDVPSLSMIEKECNKIIQ